MTARATAKRLLVYSLMLSLSFMGCVHAPGGPRICHEVWEPVAFAPFRCTEFIYGGDEFPGPISREVGEKTLMVTLVPGAVLDLPLYLGYEVLLEHGYGRDEFTERMTMLLFLPCLVTDIVVSPFALMERGAGSVKELVCGPEPDATTSTKTSSDSAKPASSARSHQRRRTTRSHRQELQTSATVSY